MSSTLHDFAPEEIMAHHDDELPVARAQQLSAHMTACADCRDLAESFNTTSQSLASWKFGSAPESLQPHASGPASWTPGPNSIASLFSWQLLRNRRILLTLGVLASAISFVYVETHSAKQMRTALRDATRVDINSYVRPREKDGAGGGGGGGDERGPTLAGKAPHFGFASPRSTPLPDTHENDDVNAANAPMIARTAELQIIVKKFEDARSAVQSIIARHQGYAASLNVGDTENTARILNASLRIRSQELPAALTELKLLGHVSNESQAGEEVTAQHADLVARLKNSRETETRLQNILRNRTGKVADVLEVEQEIARVRGEIEQMESERKSLEHRVDFATINLTITEEYKAKVSQPSPGAATQFHNAAIAGYENVTASALGLALWFTEYLPPILFWMVLLGAPAAFLWRWHRRALAAASPLV
jgi:uncharacterized protein DUF4349